VRIDSGGYLNRLQHTSDLPLEYNKIIKDRLDCGIVKVVEPGLPGITHQNVHYLPYHGVFHQAGQSILSIKGQPQLSI